MAHPRFGPFARALLVPRGRAHDLRRKFGRDHCLAPDRKRKIHRIESLHIILPVTTLFVTTLFVTTLLVATLFVERHDTVPPPRRQRPAQGSRPPRPPPHNPP